MLNDLVGQNIHNIESQPRSGGPNDSNNAQIELHTVTGGYAITKNDVVVEVSKNRHQAQKLYGEKLAS